MDIAVKSMETAVEAMESMEMATRALPHPDRVSEQRILSPEIDLRWQRRCGTLSGKTPTDLGFLRRRLFKGEGAMSEDGQGPHTIGWHTQGGPAPPPSVADPWPPSNSSSDSISCQGKIGTSGFVLSNSENISCVTFLKHKNSRK
jgi:hypothetical protein